MLEVLSVFFKRLWCGPHFLYLVIKDLFIWLWHRGWTIFNGFGLHLYLGGFGEGKTGSAVRDVYYKCQKYKCLKVLTNISLYNFPEWTKIIPLKTANDILNADENTLILIDELGTIWNSRDFKTSSGSKDSKALPKEVFQFLCQVRHRKIEVFATAQDWADVDIAIRRKIRDVCVCSSEFKHPFTRMITNRVYDSKEYDLFYQNPLLPLVAGYTDVYVQTDKLRKLYNTDEMVENMLKMEYDPEPNMSGGDITPVVTGKIDKKEQRKLLDKIRKGGIS